MRELNTINQWLGGHSITLKGLKQIIAPHKKQHYSIVEIGCGGGDNLYAIKKWALKKRITIELIGVDINEECIQYAKEKEENKDIQFVCSDYRNVNFLQKPDVIFSSLFCHHFTDEELAAQLQWCYQQSAIGFFINDLHRHPLAYYSIQLLTKLFSKSYLVKNDAPLSVARGFIKKDWEQIFKAADIHSFQCKWQWAFRWLVTCSH